MKSQRPVARLRVDRLHRDAPRLVDPMLARLRDPRELLRRCEAVVLHLDRLPAVMALAAVVRQVDIALSVAVAAPSPEVLAFQMGDRHLDPLVPHMVVRAVDGDQVAGQRVDGVEERLGRLGLRHVRLIDIAEQRHILPLQLERGEAGRAVTVRRGLFITGMGKSESHGFPFFQLLIMGFKCLVNGQGPAACSY